MPCYGAGFDTGRMEIAAPALVARRFAACARAKDVDSRDAGADADAAGGARVEEGLAEVNASWEA